VIDKYSIKIKFTNRGRINISSLIQHFKPIKTFCNCIQPKNNRYRFPLTKRYSNTSSISKTNSCTGKLNCKWLTSKRGRSTDSSIRKECNWAISIIKAISGSYSSRTAWKIEKLGVFLVSNWWNRLIQDEQFLQRYWKCYKWLEEKNEGDSMEHVECWNRPQWKKKE